MGKIMAVTSFLFYLIIGLYLINLSLNIIVLPNFIISIERWVVFLGGLLTIAGGINYLRAGMVQTN